MGLKPLARCLFVKQYSTHERKYRESSFLSILDRTNIVSRNCPHVPLAQKLKRPTK